MPVFSRFLGYFASVARHGSIRRASEELHVSASAIDRQILRAEAELEVALFERLPSGMRLTAAGELLMAAAGHWQKDYTRVRAQIADLTGLRRGHVEIAIIDALSKGFVAEVLGGMRVEFPGISFTLRVLDNAKVAGAITAGAVDFGVLLDPQSSRDLTVRAHLEVRLGFVTPPGHPLAAASQRFSAGAGHPIVAPDPPLALAQQVRALEAVTGTTLDRVTASDNIQMIKTMVSAGVGVGILTALDVAAEVESGELAFSPISDPAVRPLTLALCQMPSRQLSSAALLVLGRLETAFADAQPKGKT